MWVNPKYQQIIAETELVTAPAENGVNLATIPRGRGEQLRVTLSEYEGNPYIGIRVWVVGPDGSWYPAKGKGVSVRIREIIEVGRALAKAMKLLDERRRPALPSPAPARPGRGHDARPLLDRPREAFDEF